MNDSDPNIEPSEEISLNLVFEDKTYSILKFVALIALPAIAALYLLLSGVWGLLEPEIVVATIMIANTVLGILLSLSSRQYQMSTRGELVGFLTVHDTENGKRMELEFPGNPHDIDKHDKVTFKVRKDDL